MTEDNAKTLLVTGGTSGLGKSIVEGLVLAGHNVVLACRNSDKGAATTQDIFAILEAKKRAIRASQVITLEMDLCSIESIKDVAEHIKELKIPLHGLVLCAASVSQHPGVSSENLDEMWAANHFGHFVLARLLEEHLKQAASESGEPSRIVLVGCTNFKQLIKDDPLDALSSIPFPSQLPHHSHRIPSTAGDIFKAYARTKLCALLFTTALSQRYAAAKEQITVNVFHPGILNTNHFGSVLPPGLQRIGKTFFRSPHEGARTGLKLCLDPELASCNGCFFEDQQQRPFPIIGKDGLRVQLLWQLSERLCEAGLAKPRSNLDRETFRSASTARPAIKAVLPATTPKAVSNSTTYERDVAALSPAPVKSLKRKPSWFPDIYITA